MKLVGNWADLKFHEGPSCRILVMATNLATNSLVYTGKLGKLNNFLYILVSSNAFCTSGGSFSGCSHSSWGPLQYKLEPIDI